MPHEFIEEDVDIFQLPEADVLHKDHSDNQITIGDLHGNAMKLIFMLVKHGIATNINTTDYDNLVEVYLTPVKFLTKEHLINFNQILSEITFSRNILVRLIGDELADRGNNDYFTLMVLERLHEHHVPVEIIVSNHSIEFIEACEIQDDFKPPRLRSETHAPSMAKLQVLVNNKILTREELLATVDKSYKPTLRAISYTLSHDEQEITLYSHAPIGLNNIENLAKKLKVAFKGATACELAHTIDGINLVFQTHVQHNTLHQLYLDANMQMAYKDGNANLTDAPLEFIMWNRRYDCIYRPVVYLGYSLYFVHGHDSHGSTAANIYNLDNDLGKTQSLHQGAYTVLYSYIDNIMPEIKPVIVAQPNIQQPAKNLIKLIVKDRAELHPLFLSQVEQITMKQHTLKANGHILAADAAQALHSTIKNIHNDFAEEQIDIRIFKIKCTDAINHAKPQLEHHHGWEQVLDSVGDVAQFEHHYVIVERISQATARHCLFFKTAPANTIDQPEHTIDPINKPK